MRIDNEAVLVPDVTGEELYRGLTVVGVDIWKSPVLAFPNEQERREGRQRPYGPSDALGAQDRHKDRCRREKRDWVTEDVGPAPSHRVHLQGRHDQQGSIERHEREADEPRLFRSEEHTSELQSRENLVCRLLLEKKKK